MPRKTKESDVNLYYMKDGQAPNNMKEKINNNDRKKMKEREKRIKQRNISAKENNFDLENETVIQMTNKNKMKKEEMKRRELSKKEQKRKRRNKRIKLCLKIIVLIGIIVGGTVFAFTSPIFNIRDIEVLNNNEVSAETVISLSELKKDENIFKFNMANVSKKIKENAYIENVKISRKIPSTVKIEIEERTPRYSLDFMGKYAYINSQGYILEISDDSKGLPIIQGISTEEEKVEPGNRLNNEDLEKLEDVIKITNAAKENNLDTKVTSIDITDKNEYSIYLEEEQKKVYIGDNSNLSNKMLHVSAILEQTKGQKGYIFVNGDLNNKFRPYFREKVEV